ncbi:MAG TPA: hypothetical protein VMZ53_21410 [Kofleriaceae bacterium]|nr:hypothetical protein [Kofleriaceae bacterium]
MGVRSLVVLLVAVAACGKAADKPATTGSAGSAGSAAVPESKNVLVFVDDAQVAQVTPEQVAGWPRVDTLVPTDARRLGKWKTVTLEASSPKPIDINNPSSTFPELVPALFPGADGAPAFGYFDPVELAKKGTPQMRQDHLHDVHIKLAQNSGRGENEQGDGGGMDPSKLELVVKASGKETKLMGTQLLEMPRQPPPGENGGMGWPLAAILEKAGVTKYEKLIATDSKGTNLVLEKQDLDPKAAMPFVKLNRQGTLRFIVFKKNGETWGRGGDLRELSRVEVVK